MTIQYDSHKNQSNIRKHGLSFQTASSAFDDPQAVIEFDEDHSVNEERYNLIGAINDHIIFVVFTMRNETVRIISARPATKREIERYYGRK
ncbi:MAG: BrnT family toxin [Clostridiales bacterium]|nr:BrnT family toxin [Clostridiales bacterium]